MKNFHEHKIYASQKDAESNPSSMRSNEQSNVREARLKRLPSVKDITSMHKIRSEKTVIGSREDLLKQCLSKHFWPIGLQNVLIQSIRAAPMRYFICDNATTMAAKDGWRLHGLGPKAEYDWKKSRAMKYLTVTYLMYLQDDSMLKVV